VVDAVEGMCARTHQVLREAHSHQLVPILVVNKVDRLCTNLCLTPTEAYLRLRALLETVNATCAAMLVSKRAQEEEQHQSGNGSATNDTQKEQEEEEARWTFEPQRGNVIFGSALFGWGFTVPALSRSLFRSKKMTIKPVVLKQFLFGDFYFKPEDGGKLMKWKGGAAQQPPPIFAEFALQPIWDMYEGIASAAVVSGIGSTLFADGRMGSSGDNHHGNNSNKILAMTPGMDEVLHVMQIGSTGAAAIAIKTTDNVQQVLT
jgi:ribosome assembly protein 1